MDKKLIYFLVGFFLFFFAYQKFVLEPRLKREQTHPVGVTANQQPGAQQPAASTPPPKQNPATPPVQSPSPATASTQAPAAKEKTITVDTPYYQAVFSTRGAVLTSFRLKRFTDDFSKPLEMVPQISTGDLPLGLDFGDKRLNDVEQQAVYTSDSGDLHLGDHETGVLAFEFTDGSNTFRKRFEFKGETYLFTANVQATSGGNPVPVRISWSPGLESVKGYKEVTNLKPSRGLVNNGTKVERIDPKNVKEFKKIGATVRWAGVENNYFMAVFIPNNQPADAYMNQAAVSELKTVHNCDVLLAAQRSEPLQMSIYIGPKSYLMLQQIGMRLDDAINFGTFNPVAKALFFVLRYFYSFTGNYGWAIVLLTILIKIIFTPFTQMSFNSMKKMQGMQPELKKVQEKYAKMKSDDPRKLSMNTEIMQLHKRYGVNPLGGCLPMLVQLPVLFAFYGLLSNAIELRKAPFVLWLQDLSRPDPWHIIPLVMGGTMLLQQRMTPTTDPMQKNMMYIMPVMFIWISFKLPSGLVFYYLLSNVLAIAHQYYFQRRQKLTALKESPASS